MIEFQKIKQDECPCCFSPLNSATSAGGEAGNRKPEPGDFSMCAYCGTPLRFDDALNLRQMNEEDMAELDAFQLILLQEVSAEIKKTAAAKNGVDENTRNMR